MEKRFVSQQRVEWCRKNYHIELDELAVRAGIKPDLLRRACNRERVLTGAQLRNMGRALDLGTYFFTAKMDVSKTEMRLPHFRAAACRPQPSTELMMLLGRMERHREYFDAVLDESPRRNARKPAYPRLRPDASWAGKARAVRKWLGISGAEGFAELRARIEDRDIMVFVSNSWRRWNIHVDSKGEERFKGFALRHEVLPIIFVAKEKDERDQSFTLMHELAHLILHKVDALDGEKSLVALSRENKQEFEANALASYILLSDEARREIDAVQVENKDTRKTGLALDRICKRHRVSKAAVLAYIVASKGATAAMREWTAKQSSGKALKREVEIDAARKIWEIFGRRYVSEVLDAEAKQRLTTSTALDYMDVDLITFREVAKKKNR